MELFNPIIPTEQQHPNFRSIMHPYMQSKGEMATIQGWADGFKDRDGKFVQEFQKTFNSCFWELYLHAAFKELRCQKVTLTAPLRSVIPLAHISNYLAC